MGSLDEEIEATIASMGRVVKRPPMTAKLLGKPPFRFLHDTLTEVIKTSGFLDGLYTADEMVSSNVKEKPDKIAFLQKAIDATALATGVQLKARPGKIVAGHEPEETNRFLQAVANAVLEQVDSSDAVAQVLSGKAPTKDKRVSKDRDSSSGRKRSSRSEKPPAGPGADKDASERPERPAGASASRSRSARQSSGRSRDGRDGSGERRSRSGERKDSRKSGSRSDRSQSRERSASKEKQRHEDDFAQEGPAAAAEDAFEEGAKSADTAHGEADALRPTTARGGRRGRDEGPGPEGGLDGEEMPLPPADSAFQQSGLGETAADDETGEPALIPPVRRRERPSSARPAPPRARRGENEAPSATRVGSGRDAPAVAVIKGDEGLDDDDDDDTFVVVQADPAARSPSKDLAAQDDANEEHGALMQKILEKKQAPVGEKEPTPIITDAARQKERAAAEKEIAKLRESIQTVCRSANPLGKVIDYIQEDLDAMRKELEMWRKESDEHDQTLAEEASLTDRALQPLRAQLRDLDQSIFDQEDMIAAVKAAVFENEQRVQNMLSSVASAAK